VNVMTIGGRAGLPGKTFDGPGGKRTVTRLERDNVYWKRPGGKERKYPQHLGGFLNWLGKASEVAEPSP
jgi:hypothetical protein